MHGDRRNLIAREFPASELNHRTRSELAAAIALLPATTVAVIRESLTGLTVYAVSRRLGIAPRTVKRHRAIGLKAIGVRTLVEAASVLAAAGVEISSTPITGERSDRRAA